MKEITGQQGLLSSWVNKSRGNLQNADKSTDAENTQQTRLSEISPL